MRLIVATTNPDKLREIGSILAPTGWQVEPPDPAYPAPEETGRTFEENARLKALAYAHRSALPVAADDSGLEVDALDGAPGIASARYNGASYPEKFEAIFEALARRGLAGSAARFVCAVALAHAGRIVFEARGTVEGEIVRPRGAGGFGYDPIFYCPPLGRTLAELSPAEKDAISHRGRAFRRLGAFLRSTRSL